MRLDVAWRDVMQPAPADNRHAAFYHVVPGHDDGWDVVVEREHQVVSSTYCSDWHRVERICAVLERLESARPSRTERPTDVH
jgi:hypothetical protein